eukprot:2544356-Amphidinium_carterae.1
MSHDISFGDALLDGGASHVILPMSERTPEGKKHAKPVRLQLASGADGFDMCSEGHSRSTTSDRRFRIAFPYGGGITVGKILTYGLGVSLHSTCARATQRSEYPQKSATCNHTEIDVDVVAAVCCDDARAANVETVEYLD